MNPKHKVIVVLILVILGIGLHLREASMSSEFDSFTAGLFLWSICPYAICFVTLRIIKDKNKCIGGAAAILLFDLWIHFEVFVSPSSSTAALGLLSAPFLNMVLLFPLGLILGGYIGRKI